MFCKVKAKTKIRAHTHPIPEGKKRNHCGYSELSDTTIIVSLANVTQKRHPKHLISIKVCHQQKKKQTSIEGGLVGPRRMGQLRPGGGPAARGTQEPTLARSTKDDARCQKVEGARQCSGIPKDTRTLAVPESRSRSAPACRSSTRNIILAVITVLYCTAVAVVTFADRTTSVPPKRASEHSAPLLHKRDRKSVLATLPPHTPKLLPTRDLHAQPTLRQWGRQAGFRGGLCCSSLHCSSKINPKYCTHIGVCWSGICMC